MTKLFAIVAALFALTVPNTSQATAFYAHPILSSYTDYTSLPYYDSSAMLTPSGGPDDSKIWDLGYLPAAGLLAQFEWYGTELNPTGGTLVAVQKGGLTGAFVINQVVSNALVQTIQPVPGEITVPGIYHYAYKLATPILMTPGVYTVSVQEKCNDCTGATAWRWAAGIIPPINGRSPLAIRWTKELNKSLPSGNRAFVFSDGL